MRQTTSQADRVSTMYAPLMNVKLIDARSDWPGAQMSILQDGEYTELRWWYDGPGNG